MDPFEKGGTLPEDVRADMQLMTADDVCDVLRVSKDWLYDQVQAGKFPHRRVGRFLRFRPAEVQAWVEGEWTAPEPEAEPESLVRRRGRPRKN